MCERVCACGCGRIVKHPRASLIRGHRAGSAPPPAKFVPAACAFCGAPAIVERWRVEKFGADHVYCSRDHASLQRTADASVEFACEWCGTIFSIKGSKKNGAHVFCSLTCAAQYRVSHQHQPVFVECSQCGKRYRERPSAVARNARHYCSRECRARFIMGENNPAYRSGLGRKREYASNWKSQRRKALLRDDYTCQDCGSQSQTNRSLHVHHITPAYVFDGDWENANSLDNLITLCPQCHGAAERRTRDAVA